MQASRRRKITKEIATYIRVLTAYALFAMPFFVHAREGGQGSGGGDLCEDRIKVIRDDIKDWIKKGGARGLKLPVSLSYEDYVTNMLDQIGKAKIKCVGSGDQGYPVAIGSTPKVCRFDSVNSTLSQITCDFDKFNSTNEAGQYILVHHEYAGLARVEKPNADDSEYGISNQISDYLENQIIKKLAVKPGANRVFNEMRVGTFVTPKTEILRCSAQKLVLGKGTVLEKSQYIDVSFPNERYIHQEILQTDGLSIGFSTYGGGFSLYVIPINVKFDSLNYLAESSTSLGPIEDYQYSKLSLNYGVSPGVHISAHCSYFKYE